MRKNSDKYALQLEKVPTNEPQTVNSRDSVYPNVMTESGYLPPDGSVYYDITNHREGPSTRNSEEQRYLTKKADRLDSSISNISTYFSFWIYTIMIVSVMEVKNRSATQQATQLANFTGKWVFGDIALTFLAGLYVLSAFKNKIVQHATIACFLFSVQTFIKGKIYISDDPKLLYPFFIGCFEKIGIDFVKNFRYFAILMILIHLCVTTLVTFKVRNLIKQRSELQKEIHIDTPEGGSLKNDLL